MTRHCRFALVLLLAISSSASFAESKPETRQDMGEIFESVRFLLPLSLSEERFEDPALQERIEENLAALAASSSRLEQHGARKDASFAFLSRSLANDTREIHRRYALGRTRESRFLVQQVSRTCIACHSRLRSDADSPLSRRFADESRVKELPLEERVQLEFATRQFERALESYEALLLSPDQSADYLDFSGAFDDYLELCIRVRGDRARPARVFERVAARRDPSASLREDLQVWVRSLQELDIREPESAPLIDAKALLAVARNAERFPNQRSALVYYTEASGVLYRYVSSGSADDREVAEAFFLLGEIESRVGLSFWLSQAEAYLETSIRLAPDAPFAPEAYALLEEFLVSGYSGSGGVFVPDDVTQKLAELSDLIERASVPANGEASRVSPDPPGTEPSDRSSR